MKYINGIYYDIYHLLCERQSMSQTAKLFANGRSQAVRLPAAYRFDSQEVFIRKDMVTGDVILSSRPLDWTGFVAAAQAVEVPEDFLTPYERVTAGHTQAPERDPLDAVSKTLSN